jgi:hypothetical protein
MSFSAPTRAEISLVRSRICPSGMVRVPVLPNYHPIAIGFVFAVGTVTTNGQRHGADELDLLIEGSLRAERDAATLLAPYVQFVIARRIATPDRLSGAAATTFLRELAR